MSVRTESDRDALSDGSPWRWLGIVVSPVVLTVVAITVLYGTVGPDPVPNAPIAVYAASNVLVVALLARRLSSTATLDVFRYRVPGLEEFGVSVGVALVLIFVFDPVATAVATALGAGSSAVGSFDSALGAVIFAVASVAVAPVVEEILYRGVAFDALRGRYGALAAVVGSSLLFGAIHLFIGGVSGAVGALLSGFAYAGMRFRYDNLAGVGVAHALNNAYWVAVTLGALPTLVPG